MDKRWTTVLVEGRGRARGRAGGWGQETTTEPTVGRLRAMPCETVEAITSDLREKVTLSIATEKASVQNDTAVEGVVERDPVQKDAASAGDADNAQQRAPIKRNAMDGAGNAPRAPVKKRKAVARREPVIRDAGCLYHGATHRARFQEFLNVLRSCPGFLPKQFLARVGAAVCVCDENTAETVSIGRDFMEVELRLLFDVLRTHNAHAPEVLLGILDARVMSPSMRKLYHVLEDASNKKYSLVNPKPNKPLTFSEEITLPLPTNYLPNFIGKQGTKIRALQAQLGNGVILRIMSSKLRLLRPPRHRLVPPEPTTVVCLTAPSQAYLDAAKTPLKDAVDALIAKREKHAEKVREHNVWVMKRMTKRHALVQHCRHEVTVPDDYAMDVMEMQKHSRGSINQRKTGNTIKATPPPVLEGSTCMNCLGTYTKENTSDSCRYHSGYLLDCIWADVECGFCGNKQRFNARHLSESIRVDMFKTENFRETVMANRMLLHCKRGGRKCRLKTRQVVFGPEEGGVLQWSCCCLEVKNQTVDKVDKHASHVATGCQTGPHLWRPHRSTKSCNKVKDQAKGRRQNRDTFNLTEIQKMLKSGQGMAASAVANAASDGWCYM